MDKFKFIVDEKFNNYSVNDYLTNNGFSLEIIKKIKFGMVFVNDIKLENINLTIKTNDVIEIHLKEIGVNEFIKPIKRPLKIIFEDDYFLAVIKEKGILTHSSRHNKTLSLEEIVCGYFYPTPFVFRPINRLDKDTSGIVLIAKDMLSASLINEQIKKGLVKKSYTALVLGIPKNTNFSVEKPIKKQSDNSIKRIISDDGKYAKTDFELIKTINNLSLLKADLITGRTHQIRVHLASVNLPLYADSLYGTSVLNETYYLHASYLKFTHPFTNKVIELNNELIY